MALIILGHPHFETSVANKEIIETLKQSELDLEIRLLHELYPDYNIDVKAEQAALLRHQTIIFQYPFYWYNMPAILKHWFDEIFTYQFAYGSKGDQLKQKFFVPSFTVGGSKDQYHTLGDHHFRVEEFCKNLEQTAYFAQMRYIEPIYTHGTSNTSGEPVEVVKNKAQKHANDLLALIEQLEKTFANPELVH